MARSDNADTRLVVLSGAHKGALIRFTDDKVIVGGLESCEAVLRDDSAKASSVCVEMRDEGRFEISDCFGDVRAGNSAISYGGVVKLRTGTPIYVGDVCLALGVSQTDASSKVSAHKRRGDSLRWGAGLVMVLFFSGAVGMNGGSATPYFPKITPPASSYVSITKNGVRTAVSSLEGEILDAGLYALSIDKFPEKGIVSVSGTLPPEDEPKWREIVRWFDGNFGSYYTLQSDVRFEDVAIVMPFSIQSVVLSPWPHFILHDGRQVELGMSVPGGWIFESIDETHISFAKNAKMLIVKY